MTLLSCSVAALILPRPQTNRDGVNTAAGVVIIPAADAAAAAHTDGDVVTDMVADAVGAINLAR